MAFKLTNFMELVPGWLCKNTPGMYLLPPVVKTRKDILLTENNIKIKLPSSYLIHAAGKLLKVVPASIHHGGQVVSTFRFIRGFIRENLIPGPVEDSARSFSCHRCISTPKSGSQSPDLRRETLQANLVSSYTRPWYQPS